MELCYNETLIETSIPFTFSIVILVHWNVDLSDQFNYSYSALVHFDDKLVQTGGISGRSFELMLGFFIVLDDTVSLRKKFDEFYDRPDSTSQLLLLDHIFAWAFDKYDCSLGITYRRVKGWN